MPQATPSLQKSEWIFFIATVALISIVCLIAKMTSARSLERVARWQPEQPVPDVWIEITGHVKHPGQYKLKKGAPLQSAVRKAAPKPFADLSGIDLAHIPNHSLCLNIAPLQKIRIRVTGCVKEILELELEPGARISDLSGKIALTDRADPKFLKKRRKLKDGEVVEIPEKKERAGLVVANG